MYSWRGTEYQLDGNIAEINMRAQKDIMLIFEYVGILCKAHGTEK